MAFTVTEANAANDLITYVVRGHRLAGERITAEAAMAAANLLAGSGYRRLMAGWRGDGDIAAAWPAQPVSAPKLPSGMREVEFKTLGNAGLYEWWRAVVPTGQVDVNVLYEALHNGRCEFLREEPFDEHDREIVEVDGSRVAR